MDFSRTAAVYSTQRKKRSLSRSGGSTPPSGPNAGQPRCWDRRLASRARSEAAGVDPSSMYSMSTEYQLCGGFPQRCRQHIGRVAWLAASWSRGQAKKSSKAASRHTQQSILPSGPVPAPGNPAEGLQSRKRQPHRPAQKERESAD